MTVATLTKAWSALRKTWWTSKKHTIRERHIINYNLYVSLSVLISGLHMFKIHKVNKFNLVFRDSKEALTYRRIKPEV